MMEKPAFSLCACIRVLTTSSGCSKPLETRPAVEPAMNDVALLPTGLVAFATSAFSFFPLPMAIGSGGAGDSEKAFGTAAGREELADVG